MSKILASLVREYANDALESECGVGHTSQAERIMAEIQHLAGQIQRRTTDEQRHEMHQTLGYVEEFANSADDYARELPESDPQRLAILMTLLSLRHLREAVRMLARWDST